MFIFCRRLEGVWSGHQCGGHLNLHLLLKPIYSCLLLTFDFRTNATRSLFWTDYTHVFSASWVRVSNQNQKYIRRQDSGKNNISCVLYEAEDEACWSVNVHCSSVSTEACPIFPTVALPLAYLPRCGPPRSLCSRRNAFYTPQITEHSWRGSRL